MYEFIIYLGQSKRMANVMTFYNDASRKQKGKLMVLNQDMAECEAVILSYLYAFISYKTFAYIEDASRRRIFLIDIWEALLDFLDCFRNPQHPNTTIWVLEIFHAFSSKYLPKDVLDERRVRSPMHINMNSLLLHMGSVLSKDTKLLFKPDKSVIAYTVFPFPPSVYEYYRKYSEDKALFDFTQTSESVLNNRYRIYCMIFLVRQSVQLMKNCYGTGKTDRMAYRVRSVESNLRSKRTWTR